MPQEPHEPTAATREVVSLHTVMGTPQPIIARIIGIDPKTLRKYYRDEIDLATAKANAKIGGVLYNKAVNGDTASAIFWMKTRAGWRETNRTEHTGPDGGPIQHEDVSADAADFARRLSRLAAASAAGSDAGNADGTDEGGA